MDCQKVMLKNFVNITIVPVSEIMKYWNNVIYVKNYYLFNKLYCVILLGLLLTKFKQHIRSEKLNLEESFL